MPNETFIPFIPLLHNILLLLAMVFVYDVMFGWQDRQAWGQQAIIGGVLGAIGVAVMSSSWQLEPGVIFDARSVLLAVSGLFFGAVSTITAVTIAAAFRLYQGGAVAWTGILVIVVSGGIGIAWRRWRQPSLGYISAWELYCFGAIVHVAMLLVLVLTLPWTLASHVLTRVTLPVLILYPVGTLGLGLLMNNRRHHKQTATTLQANETLIRTTLYSIGDGVITTDAHGNIRQMNRVAEQLTGWLEVEARGKRTEEVFRLIDRTEGQADANPLEKVRWDGVEADFPNQPLLISRDGQKISLTISAAPIREESDEVTGVVLVFRDQTKEWLRDRLQQARLNLFEFAAGHSLEELMQKTLDEIGLLTGSPLGFYHFVNADQKTLSLQVWSTRTVAEFCQQGGKGRHCPLGQTGVFGDCVRAQRPAIHNDYQALPQRKDLPSCHASLVRVLVVPIVRNNRVMAILGVGNKADEYTEKDVEIVSHLADVAWEITCRKRAEDSLRTLSQAVEQSPASIVITDASGTIEFVNPKLEQVTGYTLEELRGKNSRVFKSGETPVEEYQSLWQTITSGGEWRGEFLNRKKDGSHYRERAVIAPIRDEAGRIVHFLAVKEDITEFRHAEQQYQRLFTEMQEGFALHEIICDAQGRAVDYRFLAANPAFERLTGLAVDTVLGKTVRELLPQTEPHWIETYGQVALTGEPTQFESYSQELGRVFAVAAFSPAPNQFACIFTDTTERHRAEELLIRSRDYHLQLFDRFPTLIWRSGRDGNCDYFNQTWLDFTGRTLEQELGDGWQEGVHPDDMDRCRATYLDAFARQHPFEMEYRLHHHDGTHHWLIVTGRPYYDLDHDFAGFIGSCHDISDHKRTLEHLQESEERFRQLFERSDDAIVLFDGEHCSIIDLNRVTENLFGYSRDELLAAKFPLFIGDDYRPQFTALICGLDQHSSIQVDKQLMTSSDGSQLWISVRGKLITLLHQKVVYCSFRDISTRIRLEEEARAAQAKLIQADKMASLGLLVSGIAHEINNPNNAIMFNSELLAKAWQSALPILDEYNRENGDFKVGDFQFSESREIIPKLFTSLGDGSKRIKNIVARLKNFARQDKGSTRDRFDVNTVVLDAVAILNHEIKKQCDNFRVEAGISLPPALGNAQQIEQVVINLIMNALQSLPDKRRGIMVSTRVADDDTQVVITVTDEGIGMSAEVLERLTEPFFTTKSGSGGTGLGLSISASILRENQGSISFVSEPHQGTTATVHLLAFSEELPPGGVRTS